MMIQVKSGRGRASPADREVLKRWARAYRGRAEVWRFRKGRGVKREVIFDGQTLG